MRIEDLDPSDEDLCERLARMTHASAATHAPEWLATLDDAREEIDDATQAGRVTRVLFEDDATPVAWISTFHLYGAVWEIHPLIVDVGHHRTGHGARLVADAEAIARSRGAGVMFAGTSDETGATSLGGRDLYTDPLGAMASLRFEPSHAVGFWPRVGYTLVGIIPDAEGPGRPSINFTKRLSAV